MVECGVLEGHQMLLFSGFLLSALYAHASAVFPRSAPPDLSQLDNLSACTSPGKSHPAHLYHVQHQRQKPLLDAPVPHHHISPEVQPQLVHRRLVSLLHIDPVHVLQRGRRNSTVKRKPYQVVKGGQLSAQYLGTFQTPSTSNSIGEVLLIFA